MTNRPRETGEQPAPTTTREPGAWAFVGLVWLLTITSSLVLVGRFGANLPTWDDVGLLPVITGERPVTWEWLWSPHNEHRLPLNRLALAALMRISGNDFRSGMVASVVVMGLTTLLLLAATRRARGDWRYADAIIPLLLVGPSPHAVWLWCWELQFALSAGLSLVVLSVLMRPRAIAGWDLEAALIASTALVLLPLCGVNGAVAAPALAAGLVFVTWHRRMKAPRIIVSLGSVIAMALAGLVMRAALESSQEATRPTLSSLLRTAGQFLAIGLGRPVAPVWPIVAILLMVALVVAVGTVLVSPGGRRVSSIGLLAFLASSLSIALATAWGRSSAGEMAGLESRYVLLSSPFLVGLYLVLDRRADRALHRFLTGGLVAVVWVMVWPNGSEAIAHGQDSRRQADRVEQDLRARTPTYRVVRRHVPYLGPSQLRVASALEQLRKANIGQFRRLGDNPPFDEIAVEPGSAMLRQATWDGDTMEINGVDPSASYSVDPPRYLAGIQIQYDHDSRPPGPAHFRLEWRRPGQFEFPADQVISEWALPSGSNHRATFWIDDNVAEFRIQPDNRPGTFTIRSLRLFVPAADDQAADFRDRLSNQ